MLHSRLKTNVQKTAAICFSGDDTVAHLTRISKKFSSKSSACSSNQHSSEVHMEDVFVLAGNNKVVRNNLLDEELM